MKSRDGIGTLAVDWEKRPGENPQILVACTRGCWDVTRMMGIGDVVGLGLTIERIDESIENFRNRKDRDWYAKIAHALQAHEQQLSEELGC